MIDKQLMNTDQLVQAYYNTLRDGMASLDKDRLAGILAPGLVFEGPIAGRRIGAAGFIRGVAGFVETMRGLILLQQLHTPDAAATLYDAEMPGGTVRFAEFFEIADGKIQSLRLLYDAHEYQARGGR